MRKQYVDVVGTIGSGGLTNVATTHTFTAPLTYANGTTLPTLTGSDTFLLSIKNAAGRVEEIVEVTAYNQSSGAATIARAKEGTTAVAHLSGDKVTISSYPSDFLGTWPNVLSDKATTYTAVPGDWIRADATAGAFVITLPSNPPRGSMVTVQKVDATANIVTVDPTGSGTIHGQADATLESQWAAGTFEHQGSDVWSLLATNANATSSPGSLKPATFHATYGDDFTAGSLNGKWTRAGAYVSGDETYAQGAGATYLQIAPRSGAASGGSYYYQAWTGGSADFTLTMRAVLIGPIASGNFFPAVVALDSSSDGVAGMFHTQGNMGACVESITDGSLGGGIDIPGTSKFPENLTNGGIPFYVQLNRTGTAWKARHSFGELWAPWTSTGTDSRTITRVGFTPTGYTDVPHSFAIDYFDVS